MNTLKKPRSDAKLLHLPEEQQMQLADWLLGGMPYHIARERVQKDFGITCSMSTLAGFYSAVCVPALLKRRGRAAEAAHEIAELAQAQPGRFDDATVDAIKQKAFELAISPMSKPGDVKALFVLLQKARDQELKSGKLALDREKFATALKTKIEAGLDEIAAQIGENPDARRLYDQFRAVVSAATSPPP